MLWLTCTPAQWFVARDSGTPMLWFLELTLRLSGLLELWFFESLSCLTLERFPAVTNDFNRIL